MTPRRLDGRFLTIGLTLFLALFLKTSDSATHDLLNTKSSTTDLKWTSLGGWEEVSGKDEYGNTIRYNQVCMIDEPNQNNWVRSTFINADNAKRVYLDIEYSMVKCDACRETFTLYYYPADSDVASSTFPPWQERPYIKIDTVAAGNRFDASSESHKGINHKTFSIGPLSRSGLYIAAQDQGTCMSLMSARVYYYYCPETTYNLAYFSRTIAGAEVASLIPVSGKCVSNAVYTMGEVPKYRCNSNGEWKVQTGSCQCRAGYTPNSALTSCEPCRAGYYKSVNGNEACTKCPARSSSHTSGASVCHCAVGYFRSPKDSISQACTRPPTKPTNVTYTINKTTAIIHWSSPLNDGGRDDVYFSLACEECEEDYKKCNKCPTSVRFQPSDHHHFTQTTMKIHGLQLFSHYRFKIVAHNGVSSVSKSPPSYEIVEFSTNEAVPSKVLDLRLIKRTDSALTLSWSQPAKLVNHFAKYEVLASPLQNNDYPEKVGRPRPSRPNVAPILLVTSATNITLTDLRPSTAYEVKVRARSDAGTGSYSDAVIYVTDSEPPRNEPIKEPSSNMGLIIGIVVGALVVLVLIIVGVVFRRRRQREEKARRAEEDRARAKIVGTSSAEEHQGLMESDGLIAAGNTRTTYTDYRDPHKGVKEIAREIEYTAIKIERVIGQGEFGEVCRGSLTEGRKNIVVAVKRLKRGATLIDQTNLLREACTMAQFSDPNILQLKGVVTKSMPIMIVSEFMEKGSLDKFVMANRGNFNVLQLVSMLKGIASGMRYLADMQYVHRDLAARNILVNSDYVCKVSDFGLSRNLENDPHATYTTQGGKIPIRWTAPECFRYRKFTSASDVWSYGIVMWEVMSYGEKPYWDMTNEHVTESIEDGFRLPAPQDCPQVLHRLMLDCWSYDAAARPTFREIFINMKRYTQQPDLLVDREPITDASSAFLDPDSPTDITQRTLTVAEWLELMKLGAFRQSFQDQGIQNLNEIIDITPADMERLGITQKVHRTRLQSGIQTLRRHLSGEGPNNTSTLPMQNTSGGPASPGVVLSTVPRGGAVGVGPVGTSASFHSRVSAGVNV